MTSRQFIYVCTNKRCRARSQEVTSPIGPDEQRRTTGRPAYCPNCGSVFFLRRVETPAAEPPPAA